MPRCTATAPAQYEVEDALVRCVLYDDATAARG